MRESAVSPVVAFLLILVVVVSFLSILQGHYLPGLKQEAEVQHLHAVEEGMMMVGSDIANLIGAEGKQLREEVIPLGGGDVLFSPVRSSGTLQAIPDDEPVYTVFITNQTGTVHEFPVNISTIRYEPVSGFWVNQGYFWRSGLLSVTKGNRTTPLSYVNESLADEQEIGFLSTFVRFFPKAAGDNMTGIDMGISSLTVGNKTFVSSNGIGEVLVQSTEEEVRLQNISSLMLTFRSDEQGTALKDLFTQEFYDTATRYGGVSLTSGPGLLFSPVVNSSVTKQEICVSVR